MVAKRDLYKNQGNNVLQALSKKVLSRFTVEISGKMLLISLNVLRKTV